MLLFTLPVLAADDLRWLEESESTEVIEWRDARNAESLAWLEEDGMLETVFRSVRQWTDAQRQGRALIDHRDGATLWLETRPHVDNATESDRRKWRHHYTHWVEREGTLTALPLPDGVEDDTWRPCSTLLQPGAASVLTGRRHPLPDPTDPPKEWPPCVIELVDLETLEGLPLGESPVYAGSMPPDADTMWFSSRLENKKVRLEKVALDGSSREVVSTQRRWTMPSHRDDGSMVWRQGGHPKRKRSPPTLKIADGPELKLPRGRWNWIGIDSRGAVEKPVFITDVGGSDEHPMRIVRVDPENPAKKDWDVLLEDAELDRFQTATLHHDTLLVSRVRDGAARFYEIPLAALDDGGEPPAEPVEPIGGPYQYVRVFRMFREPAVVSARKPDRAVYYLRGRDGSYTEVDAPSLVPAVFESSEATSADGTGIPVSWVRAKDAEPSGDAPVWLRAYGGFGKSQGIYIGVEEALWLEMGGIIATVHARGGNERGEEWHQGARRENIGRTFEDVIGAGEWFVDEGWTKPGRIVVSGTSNGGLTAMASLSLRPDLFGAGISDSGVLDLVRGKDMEGFWWGKEYGRPGNDAQREVLETYSPVHARPADLPPVLVTTGHEDPTVPPAHSFKLKAAWDTLEAGPVLLRVFPWTTHAHHLSKKKRDAARLEDPPDKWEQRSAERLTFLVKALDLDWDVGEPPEWTWE